jgi:hypothetical protein
MSEANDGDRTGQRQQGNEEHSAGPPASRREVTITVPLDRAVDAVTMPVATASRVLSAAGGLPFYAGLGVLAAADVISWPVAVTAGAGYLALRKWGPLQRPAVPAAGEKAG